MYDNDNTWLDVLCIESHREQRMALGRPRNFWWTRICHVLRGNCISICKFMPLCTGWIETIRV